MTKKNFDATAKTKTPAKAGSTPKIGSTGENTAMKYIKERLLKKALLLLLTLLLGTAGWMRLNAEIVHVRHGEVAIAGLPTAFEGVKVLYVTDIDITGIRTIKQIESLFSRLKQLEPDLLLLGGDYSNPSLIELLNGSGNKHTQIVEEQFFRMLMDFPAPLGKFAIAGDNDGDPEVLAKAAATGGVRLLNCEIVPVTRGGDTLYVAGIPLGARNITTLASQLKTEQCVLTMIHSPGQLVDIRIAEAEGGGSWSDLLLAGHTHGGQILLGNRPIFTLDEQEKYYIGGWYTASTTPLLVSTGVGCEAANFRLGTESEVWLLTLRRAAA